MEKVAAAIERLNAAIGRLVSLLIFVIIAVILYEVIARSLLNSPTRWAHDVSGWIQVVYVFLGGAWALQRGYFVRVDIVFQSFRPKIQAAIDLVLGTALMGVFAYVMIGEGWGFFMKAYTLGEVSNTGAWSGPVWPSKIVIPIGMSLLALAWIARSIRAIAVFFKDPAPEDDDDMKVIG